MSRKGYARLTAEMKAQRKSISRVDVWAAGHKRKIGQPVNKNIEAKIADIKKIEQDTPNSSTTNLKEDALCKVLGPEKDQNAATSIVSPSRVTTNPDSNNYKLLDWMGIGEVVAEGRWSSSDPNERVHHIPLGPNAMGVWVDVVKKHQVFLWRPTSDMVCIEEAEGTTVAWPVDKVLMDSSSMPGGFAVFELRHVLNGCYVT